MTARQRSDWRAYLLARRIGFGWAEPIARPSLVERAWIRVFG